MPGHSQVLEERSLAPLPIRNGWTGSEGAMMPSQSGPQSISVMRKSLTDDADILGKDIVAFYRAMKEINVYLNQNRTEEGVKHILAFMVNIGALAVSVVDGGLVGSVTTVAGGAGLVSPLLQVAVEQFSQSAVIGAVKDIGGGIANNILDTQSQLASGSYIRTESTVKTNFHELLDLKRKELTLKGIVGGKMKLENLPIISTICGIFKRGKGAYDTLKVTESEYEITRRFFADSVVPVFDDEIRKIIKRYKSLMFLHGQCYGKEKEANSQIKEIAFSSEHKGSKFNLLTKTRTLTSSWDKLDDVHKEFKISIEKLNKKISELPPVKPHGNKVAPANHPRVNNP